VGEGSLALTRLGLMTASLWPRPRVEAGNDKRQSRGDCQREQ